MLLNELNAIVEKEKKMVKQGKLINGAFGLEACKDAIDFKQKAFNKTLKEIYDELVVRGLNEKCFNTMMIVACEIMMEEN